MKPATRSNARPVAMASRWRRRAGELTRGTLLSCIITAASCTAPSEPAQPTVSAPTRMQSILAQYAVPSGSEAASPNVQHPAHADQVTVLTELTSRTSIAFTLRGGQHVKLEQDGRTAFAAGALADADLIRTAKSNGLEDWLYFAAAPGRERVSYEVDVTNVAGIRNVGGVVEFLDAAGTPRVHVARPYVIDADGLRLPATLSVEGCAYDQSPRAPWGRPPTAPGATVCILHIDWRATHYPVLVDPTWTTTSSMTGGRAYGGATLLASGSYLITGSEQYFAELYDPVTDTFASTGSYLEGRNTAPKAVAFGAGKALVYGGSLVGTGELMDHTEIYHEATGLFTVGPVMKKKRSDGTAALLANGKVMVAGGNVPDPVAGFPTNSKTVELFDPDTNSFTLVADAFMSPTVLVRLPSNKVLVLGTNAVGQIYDPATNTYAFTCELAPLYFRADAFLVGASNDRVLIRDSERALLYTIATNTSVPSNDYGFGAEQLTRLDSTHALATGINGGFGSPGSAATALYDLSTNTFVPGPPLHQPRMGHFTFGLGAHRAKIAGGLSNNVYLDSGESLNGSNGESCSSANECATGNCTQGVCCDVACMGTCESCAAPGHVVGTCTAVNGNAVHGTCTESDERCPMGCNGVVRDACAPVVSTCSTSCSGHVITLGTCGATGTCVVAAPADCDGDLQCGANGACLLHCASNVDCVAPLLCVQGHCGDPAVVSDSGALSSSGGGGSSGSPADGGPPTPATDGGSSSSSGDTQATSDDAGPSVTQPSALDEGGCAIRSPSGFGGSWLGVVVLVARRRRRSRSLATQAAE